MPDLAGKLREGLQQVAGDEPIIKLGTWMAQGGEQLQEGYRQVKARLPRSLTGDTGTPTRRSDIALPRDKPRARARKVSR